MLLNDLPTQFEDYDKIIVGGGVFGLSYALLSIEHKLPHRVLIVEARDTYTNDRNWCFWADSDLPEPIKPLVSNTFSQSHYSSAGVSYTLRHSDTPYCRISSQSFYSRITELIRTSHLVDLVMGQRVDVASLPQNKCLDARGNWESANDSHTMTQAFVGLSVKVKQHAYPLNEAQVMRNMRVVENGKTHFVFDYILPISATELLYEVTCFSAHPPSIKTLYDWTYTRIIDDFSPEDIEVIHREQAYLPMSVPQNIGAHQVGALSGMMRPATGYAFLQIQRQVQHLLGLKTTKPALSRLTQFMDGVFLRVIRRQPELCPQIMMRMVSRMPMRQFVDFMNNRLSFKVWISVVKSVPKKPFIKQLLRGS